MKIRKQWTAVILTLTLLLGTLPSGVRAAAPERDRLWEQTAAQVCRMAPAPVPGSIGGEWAVLALARGGYAAPEGWSESYITALKAKLDETKGILSQRKYTEYSRTAAAVSALGLDARDVGGYDLIRPLLDFEAVVRQGVNGAVWALIALDSRGYPAPDGLRQRYVTHLTDRALPDGGWSLSGRGGADPDLTAMALQALAPYRDQTPVAAAVERALAGLSRLQNQWGGFTAWGESTAESCAQVLTALCALGIPVDDPRFVKDGSTVEQALLSFRLPDGSFAHSRESGTPNQMATEQALCALAALRLAGEGESLFTMDPLPETDRGQPVKLARAAVFLPLYIWKLMG